jgi:UDP-glucose 4-epimerase
LIGWGKCEQGFRRMAARNKPAGIRSLVYGMGKGKVGIEGLSVSGRPTAIELYLFTYTHFMTPQTWLITGGAGYIGAHVADEFLANGKDVVIYDSLYRGLESRVKYLSKKHNKKIPLVVADIRDIDKFEGALSTFKPYGIIHTAALKAVGESVEKPDEYFEVNHQATIKILELISKHQIRNFIFSSTAAVYGAPNHSSSIKEDAPKKPISPYGASKLAAEGEVNRYLNLPGNHGTSLRFFNVVGAAAPELLDNSVENLIPIVMNKLSAGQPPVIYGTDYPTPDGTCIRDFVDVRDIARAHSVVAEAKVDLPLAMNVGTGVGASVRDVINMICNGLHRADAIAIDKSRRVGDPAILCADVSLIELSIGFSSRYSLSESVESLL